MAVVEIIENGGARLEVSINWLKMKADVAMTMNGEESAIELDADDLKALIRRCRAVLSAMEAANAEPQA